MLNHDTERLSEENDLLKAKLADLEAQAAGYREALEVIAGGDGDPVVIASQTLRDNVAGRSLLEQLHRAEARAAILRKTVEAARSYFPGVGCLQVMGTCPDCGNPSNSYKVCRDCIAKRMDAALSGSSRDGEDSEKPRYERSMSMTSKVKWGPYDPVAEGGRPATPEEIAEDTWCEREREALLAVAEAAGFARVAARVVPHYDDETLCYIKATNIHALAAALDRLAAVRKGEGAV